MLEHALKYASAGWRVFPVHTTIGGACSCGKDCGKDSSKQPRIKAWQKAATTDEAQIRRWWDRWPDSNIGIATGATQDGAGLTVVDIDGEANLQTLAGLPERLPGTLAATTGRGAHLYYAGALPGSKVVQGLLVRGEGGYVVAPPSLHASGRRYAWANAEPVADLPEWFRQWVLSAGGQTLTASTPLLGLGPLPAYLDKAKQRVTPKPSTPLTDRAVAGLKTPYSALEEQRIRDALKCIPANCERDAWLRVGMALHDLNWDRADGSNHGFDLWYNWSETGGDKFQGLHDLETRWSSFGRTGRSGVSLGSLYHLAAEHGYVLNAPREAPQPESEVMPHTDASRLRSGHHNETPSLFQNPTAGAVNGHTLPEAMLQPANESPLIKLNEQYACIGDIGGKCLVLGWVPSKVDETIRVPSFQQFRSFAERYSNQYVMAPKLTKKKDEDGQPIWDEEMQQLGTYWLKWRKRKSYEGIDMVPGSGEVLPGGILNLWQGFGVESRAGGSWEKMKSHIVRILAAGDAASADYIFRYAAWAVQHPAERAEVAMVFRGGKGSGKGTFANTLKRIFGQHGLQIFNSKHLVGSFNGHLRNCLLLFADEAFWAGDKQGESVLKGLITEPTLMIEQKGVDAAPWKNRLHVIMAANADWVVPASHDERRYAVFDVDNARIGDHRYFDAIQHEMNNGGVETMLHELLAIKLDGWHPRQIVQTEGLRRQKERSLDPKSEWWEGVLQDGTLPMQEPGLVASQMLLHIARDASPRLRDVSAAAIGRYLRDWGGVQIHRSNGNYWRLPELAQARFAWSKQYGAWPWRNDCREWNQKVR